MRGRLRQTNQLPLRFCPITIELLLVDSMTDPIVDVSNSPSGALGDDVFLITLDNGFEEEFETKRYNECPASARQF